MPVRKCRLPPLGLLTGFEAAARHLSFTRAAEELALSQSAVSKQVKALEAHLGHVLFERRSRCLVLTAEGHRLYQTVHELVDQLDRAAHRLHVRAAPAQVSVATSSGFASLWLIPRLKRFAILHPGIDVRISASAEVVNLEQCRLDLAVRFCAPSVAPTGAIRLFTHTTLPVCAPTLPQDARAPLRTPRDLENHILLHASISAERRAYVDWDAWLAAANVSNLRPKGSLHFNQYEQTIQAALQGQGVALGIDTLVADLMRDKLLVAPFSSSVAESRSCYLVRSPASSPKPEVDAFIRWLRSEARQ